MNYFNNGQLYNQPANNGYATEIVRITGIILTNMVSSQYIPQQVAQVVYNNISNNVNVITSFSDNIPTDNDVNFIDIKLF